MSLLGALLLPATLCLAQQPNIEQVGAAGQANLQALAAGSPAVLPSSVRNEVIGSPYADQRWLPAQLIMSNKVPLAPVPLKYDVYNKRLLMRLVDRPKDSLQLDDRLLERFILQEPATAISPARQRVFRRFTDAPVATHRTQYVEVLQDGKFSLLKQYVKLLHKAQTGAYSNGNRMDELEDKPNYYVRGSNGTAVPVKLNLKQIQSAVPELSAALQATPGAKTAKTEADWVAVFKALNARP
ncbi:hypothetical protein HMJ29_14325 [Hymenobacter taeanensis]|uniref:Uncharacterized protein n=1 Tax=Hymenobacter taeanensis TaxID=2735321 RepID=A0A6M6BJ30_9BACT|nr:MULTISPECIES: hypothetical protein [Hymenobacter]QJX48050.1 hypothetical protein HMJ29_14325 [Hymenobacter taeanensis]UOQ82501.1 hypothetical protein MUN83_06975 [Hymenobacter sp. 5414T-23]